VRKTEEERLKPLMSAMEQIVRKTEESNGVEGSNTKI
jgi:hypothetical protein